MNSHQRPRALGIQIMKVFSFDRAPNPVMPIFNALYRAIKKANINDN